MAAKILRVARLLCVAWSALACTMACAAAPLRVYRVRHAALDLEVTGLFAAVPHGGHGYVTRSELLALPQVSAHLAGNENFAPGVAVDIRGVRLETLLQRLGILPRADVVALPCSDGYRAHLTKAFLAEHHPILVLRINGVLPEQWAARTHQFNPGPYFIAYDGFRPAFRVLAHEEYAQVPANVTAIVATTAARTFGPIAPRVLSVGVERGFTIAKQNCLRCHGTGTGRGAVGGTKSGYRWSVLALLAHDNAAFFTMYVQSPRTLNWFAHMPPNPKYDAATLNALRAYFASLDTNGNTQP